MKTFASYWTWLSQKKRSFITLGGRGSFTVEIKNSEICITPKSTRKKHISNIKFAQSVWERFNSAIAGEQNKAGHYGPPKWKKCTNRTCGPWLAATIRDYQKLAGN
ncbi:hypothetical protein LBMAG56_33010 [Verrucomicrobiota bacterium]|nr:hypothetical protein LBMAG56_33010 [Verrucomicrobiota bacterium]